jgi:hypothetical protein
VTLPNQEIDLIHHKNSKAHIFISSLRIHLKLKMWSILCIYLMSVPLLCSYITFPRLSFLVPDFEGFELIWQLPDVQIIINMPITIYITYFTCILGAQQIVRCCSVSWRNTQVTNKDMWGPQSQPQFLHLLNISGRLFDTHIFDILFNTSDTICGTKIFFSDIRNN